MHKYIEKCEMENEKWKISVLQSNIYMVVYADTLIFHFTLYIKKGRTPFALIYIICMYI